MLTSNNCTCIIKLQLKTIDEEVDNMFDFLKKKYEDVTSAYVNNVMNDKDTMIIDVREPYEFSSGHIPTAKSIPLGSLSKRVKEIDMNKNVVVVCASGGRSSRAASLLSDAGFKVSNMMGGMMSWTGPVK